MVREGHKIAQLDLEEVQVETSFWNSAVICIDRISRLNAGYTLVKFRDEATRDLVLEAGVLHFDRKPVIMKPWTADLDTLKIVKSVPVWIRLPGLGLQYWGTKCLSALMSTIGIPILVDKVTKDRSMMQFARVLVEVEITETIPKSIQFLNEKGQLMEQLLEFEWLPTQCKECRVFGHSEMMCNRKQKETWRQKSRNEEEETKQDPKEQQQVTKGKEITTGGSDIGQQKTDAREVNESQELSKPPSNLAKSIQKDELVIRDSSDSAPTEWITPKRVGGNKRLVPKAQNKLKNSYNALQEKRQYLSVEVLKESDQLIHVCAKEVSSNKKFCITFVYGRNTIEERRQLWDDLSGLYFPTTPCLVAGDFNAVFEVNDRIGGRNITAMELADAQKWRALGLVVEMRTSGSHFTWTNKQTNEDRIYSKLDRVFINEDWLDLFPHAVAVVNWELLSDHCFSIIKSGVAVNYGL
ncbi:uncharacterized protein LOC133785006 [Humulus lupulus]|uniref:uncharacterized protein LOC133785006 n=1 Tax=Humulus lupulus TaxID=3486 RepID=UPI002B40EEE5|nr:uncharacterized protein LOC133785006 [Humulus lupulus]